MSASLDEERVPDMVVHGREKVQRLPCDSLMLKAHVCAGI